LRIAGLGHCSAGAPAIVAMPGKVDDDMSWNSRAYKRLRKLYGIVLSRMAGRNAARRPVAPAVGPGDGLEALERRVLLSGEGLTSGFAMLTLGADGTLWCDLRATEGSRNVTIRLDADTDRLAISDTVGLLGTPDPRIGIGGDCQSAWAPLSLVTGINIQGGSWSDTLTVDFSGGLPILAGGIRFDGGDGPPGAEAIDCLVLLGGEYPSVTHHLVDASSGWIDVGGRIVTYTGLEPIVDHLPTPDRVFEFLGGTETITLSDDGLPANNYSLIDSTLAESVRFRNPIPSAAVPNPSLTIRTSAGGGTGSDTIEIQGMDNLFAADLLIEGDGDDTLAFVVHNTATHGGDITGAAGEIIVGPSTAVSTTDPGAPHGSISLVGARVELHPGSSLVAGGIPGVPGDVEVIATAPGGSSTAAASVLLDSATIIGNDVYIEANATASASTTAVTPVLLTTAATAEAMILGASILTSEGDLTVDAATTLTATAVATPNTGIPSTTAAGAINQASSAASAVVGGISSVTVGGNLSITASNDVTVSTTADAEAGSSTVVGAAIADSQVTTMTVASIQDGVSVSEAASIHVAANTVSGVVTNALAAEQGSMSTSLPDLRAAMALASVEDTTRASITSSGSVVTTGLLEIEADSEVNSTSLADASTVTTGASGVAAASATNAVDVSREAYIGGGGAVTACDVRIEAGTNDEATDLTAEATSGAGDTDISVAAALAQNYVTANRYVAKLQPDANVTLTGGEIILHAESDANGSAIASPQDAGVAGALGVGASESRNAFANEARAEIQDGAVVTGLGSVRVTADGSLTTSTNSSAGAEADVSVPAAVSTAFPDSDVTARIGAGPSISLPGHVIVEAIQEGTHSATARTDATSGDVMIGPALSILASDDDARASLHRDVASTSGDVRVRATSTETAQADAFSGSSGAEPAGTDADSLIADTLAANDPNAGTDDEVDLPTVSDQIAEISADGTISMGAVGVAAAIAVNASRHDAAAVIADGAAVSAAGEVLVRSETWNGVSADADAGAVLSTAAIGAALAVNAPTVGNLASVESDAEVRAPIVTVEARMAPASSNIFHAEAVAGGGATVVGAAGSVALNGGMRTNVARVGQLELPDIAGIWADSRASVRATSDYSVETFAGGGAVGKALGVGASMALSAIQTITDAYVGWGASLDSAETAEVVALAAEDLDAAASGGADSSIVSVAGSLTFSGLTSVTRAYTGQLAQINQRGPAAPSQRLSLVATDDTVLGSRAGVDSTSGFLGIGVALDAGKLVKQTEAYLGEDATAAARQHVGIEATSTEDVTSYAAADQVDGEAGLAGAVNLQSVYPTTRAYVGNGAITTSHGTVYVAADSTAEVDILSGTNGTSSTASIGGSVAGTVVSKVTEAFIGVGARVDAAGWDAGIDASTGRFTYTFEPEDGEASDVAVPEDIPSLALVLTDVLASPDVTFDAPPDEPILQQRRIATPILQTVRGLAVTAISRDDIETQTIGGEADGVVAVEIAGAVSVSKNRTAAYIDDNAVINTGGGASLDQQVHVAAGTDSYHLSIVGTGPSGTVAVGPGTTLVLTDNVTEAYIDPGANVRSRRDVQVLATGREDVFSYAMGKAEGTVAVTGPLPITSIGSQTFAYVDGAAVDAEGNVRVEAVDETLTNSRAGGGEVGTVGVGTAVALTLVNKDTRAFVTGVSAQVSGRAMTADTVTVVDDMDDEGVLGSTEARGVVIQALSQEEILSSAASGLSGTVGIAGSLTAQIVDATTSAYVGPGAVVNAACGAAPCGGDQDLWIVAADEVFLYSADGSLVKGEASLAGAVDLGVIRNDTAAYVAGGAIVHAVRDVHVAAFQSTEALSGVFGAGKGTVGITGSLSMYSIGGTMPDAPFNYLKNLDGDNTVQAFLDSQVLAMVDTDGGGLLGALNDLAQLTGEDQAVAVAAGQLSPNAPVSTTLAAEVEPNATSAIIEAGATITAGGDLDVEAETNVDLWVMAGGAGLGSVRLGGSAAVATIVTKSVATVGTGAQIDVGGGVTLLARGVVDPTSFLAISAGAGTYLSIAAAAAMLESYNSATADFAGSVKSADGITVLGETVSNLDAHADAASLSAGAIGPCLATAAERGTTQAGLGDGAVIGNSSDVAVTVPSATATAQTVHDASATTLAPDAGALLAGELNAAVAEVTGTIDAYVGAGADVEAGTVAVRSLSDSDADATSIGLSLAGAFDVGVSWADAEVSPSLSAYVGEHAKVRSVMGELVVEARHNVADDDSVLPNRSSRAVGVTGSGAGFLVAEGAYAEATASANLDTHAAGDSELTGESGVTLRSLSADVAEADGGGVGASGTVGFGAAVVHTTVDGSIAAYVDAGATLNGPNIQVLAEGISRSEALGVAVSAGVVAGTANVATATASPMVNAALDGVAISDGNVLVRSTTDADADADVLGLEVSTEASVGVSSTTATVSPTVSAGTGSTADITANGLDVLSLHNVDAAGDPLSGGAWATSYACAISGGALAAEGGKAVADTSPDVSASVGGTVSVDTAVNVYSNVSQLATARALGIAASSVGVGVSLSEATAGGSTKASVADDTEKVAAGSLSVASKALAGATAQSQALTGGIYGAVTYNQATASITPEVDAFVGERATVDVEGGVELTATLDAVEDAPLARCFGIAAAGVQLGLSRANAALSPTMDVYVGPSASVTAGSVELTALNNRRADGERLARRAEAKATSSGLGVLASGNGAEATAEANGVINAYIGGSASVTTSGGLTVVAFSNDTATADAAGISIGMGSVGASVPVARSNGTTRAKLRSGADIEAGSLTVSADLHADAEAAGTAAAGGINAGTFNSATAEVLPTVEALIAGSAAPVEVDHGVLVEAHTFADGEAGAWGLEIGSLTVGASLSVASVKPNTTAAVEQGATILAGDEVSILALRNTNEAGEAEGGGATAKSRASAGTLTGATGVWAEATAGGGTSAYVGSNGAVTSGAGVLVYSGSHETASSDSRAVTVGGLCTGLSHGAATANAQTIAYVGSDTTVTVTDGGLSVLAESVSDADADIKALAGGLVGAATGNDAVALAGPTVRASVKSGVRVPQADNVLVLALSDADAYAKAFGVEVAPSVAIGVSLADADLTATVEALVGPTAELTVDGDVYVQAYSNYDLDGSRLVRDAVAEASASGGSLALTGNGADANATNSSSVTASIGHAARVEAGGKVCLHALSNDVADADGGTTSLGFAAIGVSLAETMMSGTTTAFAGPSATITADSLDILAEAHVDAATDCRAAVGGVLGSADNRATATGEPTVTAYLGDNSTGTVTHDVVVQGLLHTDVDAETGGVEISVGGGRGLSKSQVFLNPDLSAYVGGGVMLIVESGGVTVEAVHDPLNTSSSKSSASAGGLIEVDGAKATLSSTARVTAYVGAETAIALGDGGVGGIARVRAVADNNVEADGDGLTVGLVAGFGSIEASSDLTSTTMAYLGENVTLELSGETEVSATARDRSWAAAAAAGGGLASGMGADATSEVTPTVTVAVGQGATVRSDGDIKLAAISQADSDAVAKGTSIGGIDVSKSHADASLTPTVSATVGIDAVVEAGGDLYLTALSGGEMELPDGLFEPAADVDSAGDTIDLGDTHGMSDGDQIVYDSADGDPIGGLEDGRTYRVIRVDDTTVALGLIFEDEDVSGVNDTIVFPYGHYLRTGDCLIYSDQGDTAVGGLTDETAYYIRVVDDRTIKLAASAAQAETDPASFDPQTDVDGLGDTIALAGHGLSDGDAVTYRAPTPLTFADTQVDPDGAGDDIIRFSDPHGLTTGDELVYSTDGTPIGGLTDANIYFAIAIDDNTISLALTAADAAAGTAVALTAGDTAEAHTLQRAGHMPLPGLEDGNTYYVVNATADEFQLAVIPGGSAIDLNPTGIEGTHSIGIEGIDLDPAGAGPMHSLRFDIDGASATGDAHDLIGAGGALGFVSGAGGGTGGLAPSATVGAASATSGDATVTAYATGSSGALITWAGSDGSEADADLTADVDALIDDGATVSGEAVTVTSTSYANTVAVSQNVQGGLVAVGGADADTRITNDNETVLDLAATIQSGGQATIATRTYNETAVFANAEGYGVVKTGKADSDGTVAHTAKTRIGDGAEVRTQDGAIIIESVAETEGEVEAEADGGGLGSGSTADAKLKMGTSDQASEADVTVGLEAMLDGASVRVDAVVRTPNAEAYADADSTAAGADTDAYGEVSVLDSAAVNVSPGAEITGTDSVQLRARHEQQSLDARADARSTAAAGDTDAFANLEGQTPSWIYAESGALITTHNLLVQAIVDVVDVSVSADKHGALADIGKEESTWAYAPERRITFDADALILSKRDPVLVIAADGSVEEQVNVDYTEFGTHFQIDNIVNDEPGTVTFEADEMPSFSSSPDGFEAVRLGIVAGSESTIEFLETFRSVRIENNTAKGLQTQDIRPINYNIEPSVTIDVETVAIEFEVSQAWEPTLIDIDNTRSSAGDVDLRGLIDNPIGQTGVRNEGSHVRMSDSLALVLTRLANIEAPQGSVGLLDERVNVTLVDGEDLPSVFTAPDALDLTGAPETNLVVDAAQNIYLKLGGRVRETDLLPSEFGIESLDAGGSVSVDLLPPEAEITPAIATFPTRVFEEFVPQTASVTTRFRPSAGDPPQGLDLGVFGSVPNLVEATYDFDWVESGDTIRIIKIEPPAYGSGLANIRAVTDLIGSGYVYVVTDGDVNLTEESGDLLIYQIESATGDVVLTADGSILAASTHLTPQVVGNNLGLTADTGSIGTSKSDPLEIDSAHAGSGTVTASAPLGVYLDEVASTMYVASVRAESGPVWINVRDHPGVGDALLLAALPGALGAAGGAETQSDPPTIAGTEVQLHAGDILIIEGTITAGGTVLLEADVIDDADPGYGATIVVSGNVVGSDIQINGGMDDDSLDASQLATRYVLSGREGRDRLIGGLEARQFVGGADDDWFILSGLADDAQLDGGDGRDVLRGDGTGQFFDLRPGEGAPPRILGLEVVDLRNAASDELLINLDFVQHSGGMVHVLTSPHDVVDRGPNWLIRGTEIFEGLEFDDYAQGEATLKIRSAYAEVVGRYVFYNNSAWDGFDPAAGPSDDDAIATNKEPLLPGRASVPANHTSFAKGLNGIMVDILGVPGTPTLDDFAFRTGAPGSVPDPVSVTTRSMQPGVTRVTLIWDNDAIVGDWLEVTTLPSANIDLGDHDRFSYGNLPGDATGDGEVDHEDYLRLKWALWTGIAGDHAVDFDQDNEVGRGDLRALEAGFGNTLHPVPAPEEPPATPTVADVVSETELADAPEVVAAPPATNGEVYPRTDESVFVNPSARLGTASWHEVPAGPSPEVVRASSSALVEDAGARWLPESTQPQPVGDSLPAGPSTESSWLDCLELQSLDVLAMAELVPMTF